MEERTASAADAGMRLDRWLSVLEPQLSRSRWQALIREGMVRVNGKPAKPNELLRAADTVTFDVPAPIPVVVAPEAVALDILYEDADMVVVNKPPDLVVHPAPGHEAGTLVNALLHHCHDLGGIGGELRPGIVHRLDKDTSGVLVVAKHDAAMAELARQFKQREVTKEYLALVRGHPEPPTQTIASLIGRNPRDRKKMSAHPATGRRAVTHFVTVEALNACALLRLTIETGRTHQIRVHLAEIGHPVLGDRTYGGTRGRPRDPRPPRQMLHAHRLALRHPGTGEHLEFVAPLPGDMQAAIRARRAGPPAS